MDPAMQGLQMAVRGAGSGWIRRSRGHRPLSGVQDPDGSDEPGATDPCQGCRIQMDPTIQGARILVRGAGSRWIRRSKGHGSLWGVQDPDGSDDPGATDPCGGCRIQMDPTIQRPQILVSGAGSRWIRRSRGQRSLSGVQDPDGSDDRATDPCEGCRIQMDPTIQGPRSL